MMWPTILSPKPASFLNLLSAMPAFTASLPISKLSTFRPLSQCSTFLPRTTIFDSFHSPGWRSGLSAAGGSTS